MDQEFRSSGRSHVAGLLRGTGSVMCRQRSMSLHSRAFRGIGGLHDSSLRAGRRWEIVTMGAPGTPDGSSMGVQGRDQNA